MTDLFKPLSGAKDVEGAILENLDTISRIAIEGATDLKTLGPLLKIALDCQKLAVVLLKANVSKLDGARAVQDLAAELASEAVQ